jgi:nitrogen regulatory protein P-II 1
MVEEVRIEMFTRSGEAQAITTAILDTAHTGLPGDGIVAVIPTERLYLVRTRSEPSPGESWPAAEG